MSTRCMVTIKGDLGADDVIHFYRHSDGYPEGVAKSIKKFLEYASGGLIRRNADQAAGWLIIVGMQEYLAYDRENLDKLALDVVPHTSGYGSGWKVGAYEPARGFHSDIEYGYIIDIKHLKVTQLTPDEYRQFMESPSIYTNSISFGIDITNFILNYGIYE